MKNLTFEFDNYDKVININVETIMFFKKKMSNIEVIINLIKEKETSIKFNISSSCILESISAIYIEKNNKIILVWQDTDYKIILSVHKIENDDIINKMHTIISYNDNKICKCNVYPRQEIDVIKIGNSKKFVFH